MPTPNVAGLAQQQELGTGDLSIKGGKPKTTVPAAAPLSVAQGSISPSAPALAEQQQTYV